MVKEWSNRVKTNGKNGRRVVKTEVKFWAVAAGGGHGIKEESNTGQTWSKKRSNNGQMER